MLNINEIVKAVQFCIKNKSGDTTSTLMINPLCIPDYQNYCKKTPDICLYNSTNSTCKEFYKRFTAVSKEESCPFGIKIKYDCVFVESKKICLYTQVDFNENKTENGIIQNFSRKAKKEAKKAVSLPININKDLAEKNHDFYFRILKTLLDGRISLSMRGLTHALFTPLQGAMADLENIMQKDHEIESKQRLEKNLNAINNYVQQIRMLTSDDTIIIPNMLRSVTVHNMVETIKEQLKSEADNKKIIIEQGFNTEKTIKAIPSQLYIVLNNLIQNAVKYSFNGFANSPLKVRIDYKKNGNLLEIRISNEGCCITEDEIRDNKIFELGYRGINSSDRDREGTGTGLYIAKQIVEAHNGKIEVKSCPTGTPSSPETQRYFNEFCISWPIHQ